MKSLAHDFALKLSRSRLIVGYVALFAREYRIRSQVSGSLPAETCSKLEPTNSRSSFLTINTPSYFFSSPQLIGTQRRSKVASFELPRTSADKVTVCRPINPRLLRTVEQPL